MFSIFLQKFSYIYLIEYLEIYAMKLNFNSILLILILSMLFFTSCTPVFYAPNAGHTLGLDEEGDVKFSGAMLYDTKTQASGFSAELGYSPKKNIGIQTNYTNLGLSNVKHGYMFNNAVGYYHFVDKNKKAEENQMIPTENHNEGVLFDIYTGFAFGNAENRYDAGFFTPNSSFGYSTSYLNQYYLQAGMHIYFRGPVKLTFSHRFSLLNFKKVVVFGELGNRDERGTLFNDVIKIKANNPFIFNEFNCKLNIGIPKVNFYCIASLGSSNKAFPYSSTSIQIGMALDINDIASKKTEKKKPYKQPGL